MMVREYPDFYNGDTGKAILREYSKYYATRDGTIVTIDNNRARKYNKANGHIDKQRYHIPHISTDTRTNRFCDEA
jgi:hypothetical protein